MGKGVRWVKYGVDGSAGYTVDWLTKTSFLVAYQWQLLERPERCIAHLNISWVRGIGGKQSSRLCLAHYQPCSGWLLENLCDQSWSPCHWVSKQMLSCCWGTEGRTRCQGGNWPQWMFNGCLCLCWPEGGGSVATNVVCTWCGGGLCRKNIDVEVWKSGNQWVCELVSHQRKVVLFEGRAWHQNTGKPNLNRVAL